MFVNINVNYETLFLSAFSPGKVLRYVERNDTCRPFTGSLFLSDAASNPALRCFYVDKEDTQNISSLDWFKVVGSTFSDVFPPKVTLLWYRKATSSEPVKWGFTVWESNKIVETSDMIERISKPSLFRRLPGMKRHLSQRPDIAWALARGLPIDRVPAAGLRRHIPIIDYVTVSQLDQRSLLVENTPRLYRFPLNNP